MVEAGSVACSVCSEPSEGYASCGRCGSPIAGGATAQAPKMALPASTPFIKSKPSAKAEPNSAASDLAEAFGGPASPKTAATDLPLAGASQSILPPEIERGYQTQELPKAGHRDQAFVAEPAARAKPPAPKQIKRAPPRATLLPIGLIYIVKSALSILFLTALAATAIFLFFSQRDSQNPKSAAPRLARRYLSTLAATDYASAYYLLSIAAQARCSIDEFREMRGPGEWTWGNLQLAATEPDAAVVSYDWSANGRPAQTVYMFFVRENGRWAVPYNLNLLKRVEDAMRNNDPDLALLESQEAVRVNPRDPMARAYLCEAAYFRKLYEQAKPECLAALQLNDKYPSNLTPQSVAHLKVVASILEQGK